MHKELPVQTDRGKFILNIFWADCLLLSRTQLYLQPISENTGSITHQEGVAPSYSVGIDVIGELFHCSLTVYL